MSSLDSGAATIRTTTASTAANSPPARIGLVQARLLEERLGRLSSANTASPDATSGRSMSTYVTVSVTDADFDERIVLFPR